jgi:8-oxo-dGTP pyrophosphatase MutT (NUDIX family)
LVAEQGGARDLRAPVARQAARVLLFDAQGRILLLEGHDPAHLERHWWFTPGGGLEDGESHREAAIRELTEETGFEVLDADLIGPVWERLAVFDFMDTPYLQHEQFFVAHLGADAQAGEPAWAPSEVDTLDTTRWLTRAELASVAIEVFPQQLSELLDTVTPWDGVLRHLGEEHA